MKRRNFLGSLITLPFATKALIANVSEEKPQPIKPIFDEATRWESKESELLSKEFFEYIHWNKTKFEWRIMETPARLVISNPVIAKTRRISSVVHEDIFKPSEKEIRNYLIKDIVKELEEEYKFHNLKYFGFYSLIVTPRIYDPDTFKPMKGVLIRYARISKDNWNENTFKWGDRK